MNIKIKKGKYKCRLKKGDENKMDKANKAIRCTVSQCANHCKASDYCTLSSVSIGTHEANPTQCQCIDCNSFCMK